MADAQAARTRGRLPEKWRLSLYWRFGPMKIKNSIKALRNRHRDCQVVRRRGRVYVINKTQRRFKARQG